MQLHQVVDSTLSLWSQVAQCGDFCIGSSSCYSASGGMIRTNVVAAPHEPPSFPALSFLPPPLPLSPLLSPYPLSSPSQGETLSSATTVGQLGVTPGQSVELQVQEATPITLEGETPANFHRSTATVTHSAHRMPDVFTVQVRVC